MKKLSLAAHFLNMSAGELLDRNNLELIDRAAAYAMADKEAESIAFDISKG